MRGLRAILAAVLGLLPATSVHAEGPSLHLLKRGETVWGISERHGVPADEIVRLNHLDDVHTLPVGLHLLIPLPGAGTGGSGEVDEALATAFHQLRMARFEEAQASAARGLDALAQPASAGDRLRRAWLEQVIATVELAFGRREQALDHLSSALE
ncbi:MAG: LysM domain-containing protein, partial [Myxococcota bacterium]